LFGQLTDARLHNHYGPSETHVVTAFTLGEDVSDWAALPPIGQAIANTQAYVLDGALKVVPVGVPGELCIGGIQVGIAYLNRTKLTAEKFIADPFSINPDARLYRTGDRVRYRVDGTLDYLRRVDDQVKLRGFRIELGEIEARLASHELVKSAIVLLREDSPGDQRLVAYVVPESTQEVEVALLRTWCREYLPDYMVPSNFMVLDAIPLTPNGKVNRKALPAPMVQRAGVGELPMSQAERNLSRIWQHLLKVDQVYLEDNFFDLGGHSLLTIELAQLLKAATGQMLSIADVFENPTLREFAPLLDDAVWDMQQIDLAEAEGVIGRIWRIIRRTFRID
jgi:hypothetical protein